MSKSTSTNKGFTLIELVIVLAIAALVIAAVLLAVGGAQRSQRDTATKNAAGRMASALQDYASNNNGKMPPSGTAIGASYLTGIQDGLGGAPKVAAAAAAGSGNEIAYEGSSKCVNNGGPGGITAGGGSNRNYAVDYWVENGATDVCTDNT